MTIWDTIFLIGSSLLILFSTVELMTKDMWRATMGFCLAMNINTVVDILIKVLK